MAARCGFTPIAKWATESPPYGSHRRTSSTTNGPHDVFDWILNPAGYLGLFLFMVLTGCGLPLPEEVAIVAAGVMSAEGQLQPEGALVACLLGALIGDAVMYGIGRRFGHSLLVRHPRFAKFLHADRAEDFERVVLRHGFKVLLIARFMIGVRGPMYLAAGAVRIPFRRFLLWDLVCATLVVGAFFGVSYYFGRDIARLLRDAETLLTIIVLAVVAIVTYVALRRYRARIAEQVLRKVEELPTAEEERSKHRESAHS